jgi:superfamily II DNA helicase RecQ
MQLKMFTIPVIGGEQINEELNRFVRAKKVIKLEKQLLALGTDAYWCCCVSYVDDVAGVYKERGKVDYRQELDEATFARFSKMREIRRQIADAEGIPAYGVFKDEELAAMAKIENLSLQDLRKIKGIGEKRVEKYVAQFITTTHDKTE